MFTPFGLFAGIVMLGILVFIHELGHFAVAKLAGVKVLKFSLGFGPRLVSRRWGETEYMICAVPLGGYVQMLGEGGGEEGEEAHLSPEEEKRSFAAQPVSRRTAIIAAGPLMNLIFPFLVLPLAYLLGVNLPAYVDEPPCIGHVLPESPAAAAGFQTHDCIEAINGEPVPTWNDANAALVTHLGATLEFKVSRQKETVKLTLAPEEGSIEGLQSLGLYPGQEAVVGGLIPNRPAKAAGVKEGDRIVRIGNRPIGSWYDLQEAIQASEGKPQTYVIEREGKTIELSIAPVRDEDNGDRYLIGIVPHERTVLKRFGPIDAIKAGFDQSLEIIKLTLVFIKKLFAGEVSAKYIGGPIRVVQFAGAAAQADFVAVLSVLALLSINLGILNLLPVPILDGGHLLFNLVELLIRRPLSLRAREIAQQIGLILILMLMVLAFYNDIVSIFFGGQ